MIKCLTHLARLLPNGHSNDPHQEHADTEDGEGEPDALLKHDLHAVRGAKSVRSTHTPEHHLKAHSLFQVPPAAL